MTSLTVREWAGLLMCIHWATGTAERQAVGKDRVQGWELVLLFLWGDASLFVFFQSVLLKSVSASTKVKLHFCFLLNCQSATVDACFVIRAQSVETFRAKGGTILQKARCVLNEMLWLDLRNTVSSFLCCGCCTGMGTETQKWTDPRAKLLKLVVTKRAFKCTLTSITFDIIHYNSHVCEVSRAEGRQVETVKWTRWSLLKWMRAVLITVSKQQNLHK